ncbi:MAG: hypothetical protein J6O53_00150 [Eubacterium sp.]|nr:hypothetical protein [Eubacterium sp.]
MSKVRMNLGELMLKRLSRSFEVEKKDIGADAKKKKKGITLCTDVYDITGVGRLCMLHMNGFLGLIHMETAVLSVTGRDVPLFNIDYMKIMGKEAVIFEMYDTQLKPYPGKVQELLKKISERDCDLEEYCSDEEHWYDEILYPCSYHRMGRKVTARLKQSAKEYMHIFVSRLEHTSECNAMEKLLKQAKNKAFAERLYAEGGQAVEQVRSLFGDEFAEKLIQDYMYDVK